MWRKQIKVVLISLILFITRDRCIEMGKHNKLRLYNTQNQRFTIMLFLRGLGEGECVLFLQLCPPSFGDSIEAVDVLIVHLMLDITHKHGTIRD